MAGSGSGRSGSSRSTGGGVAKPVGWAQAPSARADRVSMAADRNRWAGQLKSMPKQARRAITVAKNVRAAHRVGVMGEVAAGLNAIDEGRIRLAGNYRRRKGRLSAGEVGAIARAMAGSAARLKVAAARWET